MYLFIRHNDYDASDIEQVTKAELDDRIKKYAVDNWGIHIRSGEIEVYKITKKFSEDELKEIITGHINNETARREIIKALKDEGFKITEDLIAKRAKEQR